MFMWAIFTCSLTITEETKRKPSAPRLSSGSRKFSMGLSLLAALSSGILLILAFPRQDISVLAFFSLVPLILILPGRKLFTVGATFFIAGVTFFLGLLFWLRLCLVHYGNFSGFNSLLLVVLLAIYLALFWGVLGLVQSLLYRRWGWGSVWFLPFNWTALEYLRGIGNIGFPWGGLGYSQYANLSLIQISRMSGVYGVSFLIVLSNVALASLIFYFFRKGFFKRELLIILVVGMVFFLCWIYGNHTLKTQEENNFTVSLVQGDVHMLGSRERSEKEVMENYLRLSHEAYTQHPELVIWPESSTPFLLSLPSPEMEKVRNLAQEGHTYLLIGSMDVQIEDPDYQYFNGAFLISPQGKILDRYHKIQLVPFGEYLPRPFSFARRLVAGARGRDIERGSRFTIFQHPRAKFAVMICFESIFPRIARRMVREGAEFLINITNDSWFVGAGPYQHAYAAIFRAVENNVSLVRVATTGLSFTVDSRGRIKKEIPAGSITYLTDQIALSSRRTFYTRYGDIFAWFCITVIAFLLITAIKR